MHIYAYIPSISPFKAGHGDRRRGWPDDELLHETWAVPARFIFQSLMVPLAKDRSIPSGKLT